MIAALTQSLSTDKLPVNWFDAALLAILGFGLFRGRKNGMTKEVLPMLEWLTLVVVSGLGGAIVAQLYTNACGLGKLASGLLGYLTLALLVFVIFSGVKKTLKPRLTGSNLFGHGEYYLGMPSGMIRYFCILIFALALLNARFYTAGEIEQTQIYNQRWYGGGIYSGDYVPDLHAVQESVFKESFTGPYIKHYLGALLIETGPSSSQARRHKSRSR